jgi:hypothetical protein
MQLTAVFKGIRGPSALHLPGHITPFAFAPAIYAQAARAAQGQLAHSKKRRLRRRLKARSHRQGTLRFMAASAACSGRFEAIFCAICGALD